LPVHFDPYSNFKQTSGFKRTRISHLIAFYFNIVLLPHPFIDNWRFIYYSKQRIISNQMNSQSPIWFKKKFLLLVTLWNYIHLYWLFVFENLATPTQKCIWFVKHYSSLPHSLTRKKERKKETNNFFLFKS